MDNRKAHIHQEQMRLPSADNILIDLSNDSSPTVPNRYPRAREAKANDGKKYPQSRSNTGQSTAPIDLTGSTSNQSHRRSRSREQSPRPKKMRILLDESGRSEQQSASAISSNPHGRSGDGALITYNLLHFIDDLRNDDILTINPVNPPPCAEHEHDPHWNNCNQPHHYTQNDRWSCGFRNLQMIISAMPPALHAMFPQGPPSIMEIQRSFELLWSEGFDPNGAKHHDSKMVGKSGTISWIGAVEVWSYLAFRGVDSTIVQFAETAEGRSRLGPFVWAYFQRCRRKCRCGGGGRVASSREYAGDLLRVARCMREGGRLEDSGCRWTLLPLYLQWSGHSVTVVGIRRDGRGTGDGASGGRYHLIVFDPQKSGKLMVARFKARLRNGVGGEEPNGISFVELSMEGLQYKDTQVILSTAQIMNEGEREQCKQKVGCISVTH